jgi:hypothetical protein
VGTQHQIVPMHYFVAAAKSDQLLDLTTATPLDARHISA